MTARPAGRAAAPSTAERLQGEESPGSTETRCRITSGGGDPRESATESKPPRLHSRCLVRASGCANGNVGGVRVKGWGKSPPRRWQQRRHGKPHREQDRIGMTRGASPRPVSGPVIRVGCSRSGASRIPEEWPPRRVASAAWPYRTRLTGRLAFLINDRSYPPLPCAAR